MKANLKPYVKLNVCSKRILHPQDGVKRQAPQRLDISSVTSHQRFFHETYVGDLSGNVGA